MAKLVSAKCALAARIDSFHDKETRAGRMGLGTSSSAFATHTINSLHFTEFREKISTQIEKAMEPPPARMEKALPRPDDAHPKKRAGKRYVRGLSSCVDSDWLVVCGV